MCFLKHVISGERGNNFVLHERINQQMKPVALVSSFPLHLTVRGGDPMGFRYMSFSSLICF